MANLITFLRITCSIALILCTPLSVNFYIFYVIAGISDMTDGAVARKTNTVSKFGSKFDTVADFLLFAVCFIKFIPVLNAPKWLYIWIAVIAVIKVINMISGFVVQKKFVTPHTVMNKITGILLFLLPLTLSFVEFKYSAFAVCLTATFAAVQEGHFIRTKRGG